ncbi:hypothetical protein LUZ60_000313 [Juncus effusus]|nr:hypothetical protein LUZ60_000313 [Juncus effusus]
MEYIGQLVGTYVAWPAHLVELPDKRRNRPPVKKKQSDKVQSASSAVKRDPILDEAVLRVLNSKSQWLYTVLMSQPSNIFSFEIQFGEEVFGIDDTIVLLISDIVDLFKDDWLNVSILQIFCMNHWILLVLQMSKFVVYIVNPTNQNVSGLLIQNALNTATRRFRMEKNMKGQKNLKYLRIQCPQQTGGRECGYYVMRIMYDIITNYGQQGSALPKSIGPDVYPKKDIEEVKDMVVDFIKENI